MPFLQSLNSSSWKGEKNKRLNNFNLLSPAKTAYLVLQLAPCIVLFFQTTCSGSLQ